MSPPLFGLLVVLSLHVAEGEHVMRQLTFCQLKEVDAGFDLSFGEDELWYVEPYYYQAHQRLPEFAADWSLKPSLPSDAYYSIGTCFYNIPRCSKGEEYPPETIAPPQSVLYSKRAVRLGVQNTLICFVTDFHPAPVKVTWTRNEEPVNETEVRQTQYYSNPDYSFRTFSYLDFIPKLGDVYSCTVRHRGLQDPLTRFWELELQTDSQVVETTVCVLGVTLGILGVSVGVGLIIRARRS
ncbi:H-2 class II histocompatibility antigen, A-U alpha chain-like isoform X1 [Pygocentrus nattereri]|uniref:H-2 class II histocompatibility antigen, A-U alpha chain-like isoform X1 n=1 Tax=Pygocentrus nattereri TaxID=42514 RepID=UPI0018913810|nr:H-2 class II histocompatibility antigen, A-U alpha chain-like isoform X1 [Pygocentrus nattereri]